MRSLFIIIDGLGYDQLRHFMPAGLAERSQQVGLAPVTTLLAYSSGIYPSIWTGRYPDEHNAWTEFYRLEATRFSLTAPLQLIPGKYMPRKLAYVALAALKSLGLKLDDYYGVPPQLQSRFGRARFQYDCLPPVPLPGWPIISEVFERYGLSWKYILCDKLDGESGQRLREAASRSDILIVCLPELDEAGHKLGPLSQAFGQVFREFDAHLLSLITDLERASPDHKYTFFFSDHGMTPVTTQFDAWSYLERRGFHLGQDYLAFINSTLASLWFDSGHADEIAAALNASDQGRVLTAAERAAYHLNFKSRRYGDEIFLVAEGVELIPNFISLAWQLNRGMHGYDPLCASTRAFLIGGSQVEACPRDVVGLYDLLLQTALPANRQVRG